MWDLIVSVPDHCLSFYFTRLVKIHQFIHKILSLYEKLTSIKDHNSVENE